jgi:hypothetical protein
MRFGAAQALQAIFWAQNRPKMPKNGPKQLFRVDFSNNCAIFYKIWHFYGITVIAGENA